MSTIEIPSSNIIDKNQSSSTSNIIDNSYGKTIENYLDDIFTIVLEHEILKKSMKTGKDSIFHKILSLFGYKYSSVIANSNFFHFASESLIIEIFRKLQLKPEEKKSYKSILEFIKTVEIEEVEFLGNIEILIGGPLMEKEMTIGSSFLRNTIKARSKVLNDIEEIIPQEVFLKLIKQIFLLAVNYAINDYEGVIINGSYLEEFTKLQKEDSNLTLKVFTEKMCKRFDSELSPELENACKSFFNLANSNFDDLINDLHVFNLHSTSLIFHLKNIFLNNFQEYGKTLAKLLRLSDENVNFVKSQFSIITTNYDKVNNLIRSMKNTTTTKIDEMRTWIDETYTKELKVVSNYYQDVNTFSSEKLVQIKGNLKSMNEWINTSYLVTKLSSPISIAGEKVYNITRSTRVFLYESIYSPVKDLTVNVSNTTIDFVVNKSAFLRSNVTEMTSLIVEKLQNMLATTKNYLFDSKDEPLYIVENTEEYLIISISRKVAAIPSKIIAFLQFIIEKIKNMEYKKDALQLYESSKQKSQEIYNYSLDTTQVFYSNSKTKLMELSDTMINKYKLFMKSETEKSVAGNESSVAGTEKLLKQE